jgi:hypothetical protein
MLLKPYNTQLAIVINTMAKPSFGQETNSFFENKDIRAAISLDQILVQLFYSSLLYTNNNEVNFPILFLPVSANYVVKT